MNWPRLQALPVRPCGGCLTSRCNFDSEMHPWTCLLTRSWTLSLWNSVQRCLWNSLQLSFWLSSADVCEADSNVSLHWRCRKSDSPVATILLYVHTAVSTHRLAGEGFRCTDTKSRKQIFCRYWKRLSPSCGSKFRFRSAGINNEATCPRAWWVMTELDKHASIWITKSHFFAGGCLQEQSWLKSSRFHLGFTSKQLSWSKNCGFGPCLT